MSFSPVTVLNIYQGCDAPLRIGLSHIGQAICIAGKTHDRGFGAHAHSHIRITSQTPMREFRAFVGFDDNPIVRGRRDLPRLEFRVEVGGKVLWQGSLIGLGEAAQEVCVPLGGAKEADLLVQAVKEQAPGLPSKQVSTTVQYYAQADWADPQVRLEDGQVVQLGHRQVGESALSSARGQCLPPFSAQDRDIIRRLAEEIAEIASLPVQQRKIDEWKRLNALKPVKPLVLIHTTESPVHELDAFGELTLQTRHPLCHAIEQDLRMRLYQWKRVRCDMVVEAVYHVPVVYRDSGFGYSTQEDTVVTDPDSPIVGHKYYAQIKSDKDIERISLPTVLADHEATELSYQAAKELLGDILRVEKRGMNNYTFCPVDDLCSWMGIEESMICLVERPELFHAGMEKLTQAHLHRVRQLQEMGLLTASFGNGTKTLSGCLAYTDELPRKGVDPAKAQLVDIWGGAAAQLFTAVSPDMHEEFAVQYEKRVLAMFGLTAYGCCEALHNKIHILERNIPNLRKVSVTPWADVDVAAANIGTKYVYTRKPNPAIFAADKFDLAAARKDFRSFLHRTRGCIVEVAIKDLSTVRNEPSRLFDWAQMADEETARLA